MMNISNNISLRVMIRILVMILLLIIFDNPVAMALSDNLNGSAKVTWVDSSTDTLTTRSVNQNYTVNWTKNFGEYVRFRANMRYYHLGIEQERSRNPWQSQYQPTGEIIWRHPKFTLGASARKSVSMIQGSTSNLVRENFGINLKTRTFGIPIITLRVDGNRTYNKGANLQRDTRDIRSQFGAKHAIGIHNFQYSYTNTYTKNYLNDLTVTDNNHSVRWSQTSYKLDKKLRFSTSYNFNYRSQTTDHNKSSSIYLETPLFRGLYSLDATPELDQLENIPGLTDDDLESPTQPLINIGENNINANIAVDFGYSREVDGLYIYTDRLSGQDVQWDVYISNDNFEWHLISNGVVSTFDLNFNRYEIYFGNQDTRYIKGVRTGFNDVEEVFVTEIIGVKFSESNERTSREMMSHNFDLSSNYQFTKRLSTAFDFTYRKMPITDFSNGRDMVYFSVNTRHQLTSKLKQNIVFHNGYDKFVGSRTKNLNRNISYNLKYQVITTLDFLFSAVTRSTYVNDLIDQEVNSLLLHSNADVWEGLTINGEINYNRYNRFGGLSSLDTWTYKLSGDAQLLPNLGAIFSYSTQMTSGGGDYNDRVRHQYALDSDYRMTRSILVRGRVSINEDENVKNVNQNYIISWIVGSKLTINGNVIINDNSSGSDSERYSVRFNYTLSSRGSIFVSYSDSETNLTERRSVESVQAGLRIGF